ncbi:centromere protein K isoform X1 [Anolis carolinensis]
MAGRKRAGIHRAENFANNKQNMSPTITSPLTSSDDAKEQLIEECEEMWRVIEECQNKLALQETETLPDSDPKLPLLMKRLKTQTAEFNQWQKKEPGVITTNPEVLVTLGRDQLQKLDQELEMVLSSVQARNKNLKQNLLREQQWLEEHQRLIDDLNQIEEELSNEIVNLSEKRVFQELETKTLTVTACKDKMLTALGEFLEEHFPIPEKCETTRKKRRSEPEVQLTTLHEILENLIEKHVIAPHDPYITINASFWPPYVELLLRYGTALRHPEDPDRIRLENFDN